MKTGNSPSYLIRNPYSYCFRIKIPKDLQTTVSIKELRYSLGTGNLSAAKTKARYMAGSVQLLFRNIQRGYLKEMNLTTVQTQEMLKQYLQGLIQEYDKPAVPDWQTDEQNQHTWGSDQEAVEGSIQVLDEMKAEYRAKVHSGDYAEAEPIAVQLLAEHGISESQMDKTSTVYHYLCSGILRAKIKDFEHQQARLSGKFSDDLEGVFNDSITEPSVQTRTLPPSPTPADTTPEPVDHGPLLSEFMEEHDAANSGWSPATRKEYQSCAKVTLKILGDVPVGTLDRSTMVNYRKTLIKTPTYWTTRHRKIPVTDLPIPGVETIKKKTVKKNIAYVSGLIKAIVDEGDLPDNTMPLSPLNMPDDSIEVLPLDNDMVKTVMALTDQPKDYHHWIIRLGYYTGARQNELCQLHKTDIRQIDGIWCIDINDEGLKNVKDRRTKKVKPSVRVVPIHPVLIETGFLEYVQDIKHHRVFPECKRDKEGSYSDAFGSWFNRVCLADTGIKELGDRSLNFHSLRHRVYTTLKRLGINNEHIDRITGHKLSETKNETYHHGYEVETLKSAIDQILDHRTI